MAVALLGDLAPPKADCYRAHPVLLPTAPVMARRDLSVEERQFDQLARLLRRSGTRRQGLGAMIAALSGVALTRDARGRDCLYIGQRCGKKSGKNGGPCRRCCTGYATEKKHPRCTCRPDGFACESAGPCCSGNCNRGVCGDRPRCIPLNQRCGPGTTCCSSENRCAPHAGQDAQLRCCAFTGIACVEATDCCSGACSGEGGASGVCLSAPSPDGVSEPNDEQAAATS
jgi:hypothetical protein